VLWAKPTTASHAQNADAGVKNHLGDVLCHHVGSHVVGWAVEQLELASADQISQVVKLGGHVARALHLITIRCHVDGGLVVNEHERDWELVVDQF